MSAPYFQSAFPVSEFRERRAALMRRIGDQAVAVIAGAPGTGAFDYFRQTNEFFYLSGVEVPHAYLLIDGREHASTLYLPHHDAKHERSEGAQLHCDAPELVCEVTGIERVRPLKALADDVRQASAIYTPRAPAEGRQASRDTLLHQQHVAAADPWVIPASREQYLQSRLKEVAPQASLEDLSPILDQLRVIKSERELDIMRRAGQLTAEATRQALLRTRAGLFEYHLAVAADEVFLRERVQGFGYRPIIASGENIWNAHYYRNNCELRDGDLVLMDYAPDVDYYTSDIGRMWPISGRYSPVQRELYGFVVAYHEALIEVLRPGETIDTLAREAADLIYPVWEAWPFSQTNYRQAAKQMIDSTVAFTHPVGMAVHDVGQYKHEALRPGFVFALDPQLWVPDERLYYRVEDTVAIVDSGIEVLTDAMPRRPEEFEELLATR